MNERIEALIEQCKHTSTTYFDGRGNVTETYFDKEKFAELIVRECAKFLDENSGYDDANNSWHPEPEDLLKYFGVE